MEEKRMEEMQEEMVHILGTALHFMESGKYDTALRYVSNEYYILKNDLFANTTKQTSLKTNN